MAGKGIRGFQFNGDAVSGGGVVRNLRLGEAFAGTPTAAYPKIKKLLTIDATNDQLEFTDEGGTYQISIAQGEYIYPYTALESDIETKMNAATASANVYNVILEEENHKIESDSGLFTMNKAQANSILGSLGFVTLDTSEDSTFFRADAIHDFDLEILLYKVNTDSDLNPPLLADGSFTPVAANHRARSFSGFVTAAGAALDTVSLFTSGEIGGFSGLVINNDYFTNGTAGEISQTSVANSLEVGEPKNATVIVLDPSLKGFQFNTEPDTDILPNTGDGILTWETLPEIPYFSEDNVTLHSCGFDGDKVVGAYCTSEGAPNPLRIVYSTNRGKTWKKATFQGKDEGPQTVISGAIGNGSSDPYTYEPNVSVEGDSVFVSYTIFQSGQPPEIRGVYGTIDFNGNLDLQQTNEFRGSPYVNSISRTDAPTPKHASKVTRKNGVIYLTYLNSNNNGTLNIHSSADGGATFTDERTVKNVAASPTLSTASSNDYQPHQLISVDVPGQSVDNSELLTNGDFETGDLTGWTAVAPTGGSTGVWSVNGDNQLEMAAGNSVGVLGYVYQAFTTVAGKTYKISFDLVSDKSRNIFINSRQDSIGGSVITTYQRVGSGNTRREFTFVAPTTTSVIQVWGALNSADTMIVDNFNITEVAQNRVAVVVPCTGNGVGNCFNNLFYTDDQDINNNWATALDLGELLGTTYHLPIGAHLDTENDLWYIHSVAGHASANASGATARTGSTTLAQVTEIDLSQVTPSIQNGTVDFIDDIFMQNGSGVVNNNGRNFHFTPNNITKDSNGNILLVNSEANGGAFIALITDMSDVANNNEVVQVNGASSLEPKYAEYQIAAISSGIQYVAKETFTEFASALSKGKVIAREVTVDTSAKSELITNGTFDTDISGWTDDSIGSGSISWSSGNIFIDIVGGGNTGVATQDVVTEPGKTYIVSYELVSGSNSNVGVSRGDTAWFENIIAQDNDNPAPGTHVFSFRAVSNLSKIFLTTSNGAGAIDLTYDNISIQEASVQIGNTLDIIDKPNVDEQGFAGRMKIMYDSQTLHLMAEAVKDIEDSSAEQLVYNNFGFKTIATTSKFRDFPKEVQDSQGTDTTAKGVGADGDNVVIILTDDTNYKVYLSTDKGDNFNLVETIAVNPDLPENQYESRTPKVLVEGNLVIITYLNASNDLVGKIGTIADNSLVLSDIVGSGAGSSILDSGTVIIAHNVVKSGSKVVVCANAETSTNIVMAVSNDSGATFGSQIIAKDNVTDATSRTDVYTRLMISSTGRIVIAGNTLGASSFVRFLFTDDDGATWYPQVVLRNIGNVDSISGWIVNGNKLAVLLTSDAVGVDQLGLVIVNDVDNLDSTGIDSLTSILSATNVFKSGNLFYANNTQVGFWETDSSLIFTVNVSGATRAGVEIVKISDTSDVAGSLESVSVEAVDQATQFIHPELVKEESQLRLFYKEETSTAATLTSGLIYQRLVTNTTPEAAGNIIVGQRQELSGKSSISGFAGRTLVDAKSRLICFEQDNALGFEGVFVNVFKERQLNEEVEEFRSVPPIATVNGFDMATYTFDRIGDSIILHTAPVGTNGHRMVQSNDGGKNWFEFETAVSAYSYNNTTDYFSRSSPVKINPNNPNEAVMLYGESTTSDILSRNYSRASSFDNWGNASQAAAITFGGATPRDLRLCYDAVNNKLYAGGRDNTSNTYNVNVSSDFGLTWGTQQVVEDNGVTATVWSAAPIYMDCINLGGGNTRLFVIGTNNTNPFEVKMWYSDDDGVTWASAIILQNLDSNNDVLIGAKRRGNKLALAMWGSADTDGIYLTICEDLTAVTPSFSAGVNISDNLGVIDQYNGYSISSGSMEFYKMSLDRISWISDTSLLVGYNRAGSVSHDVVIAKVADTSNIAGSISHAVLEGTGSDLYQESGLIVKSDSNEYFVLTSLTNSNRTNNTTSGRLLSIKIENVSDMSDVTFGYLQDIGFKPTVAGGGFLGRIQVQDDTVLFEKEDGGSLEQLYFNSVELRSVQKGT